MIAGRPAGIRKRDEATGLALLEVSGLNAPPVLVSSSGESADVLVLAFPPVAAGMPANTSLTDLQVSSGLLLNSNGKPRVAAALQQPGAGAALFSRNNRLLGFAMLAVKGAPQLVAGIVPESIYPLARAERMLQTGVVSAAPANKTAGEVLATIGPSLVPVTCSAAP
jgi:hypothetical protein